MSVFHVPSRRASERGATALELLCERVETFRTRSLVAEDFEAVERELHAQFIAAEREVLGELLERLDIQRRAPPARAVPGGVRHRAGRPGRRASGGRLRPRAGLSFRICVTTTPLGARDAWSGRPPLGRRAAGVAKAALPGNGTVRTAPCTDTRAAGRTPTAARRACGRWRDGSDRHARSSEPAPAVMRPSGRRGEAGADSIRPGHGGSHRRPETRMPPRACLPRPISCSQPRGGPCRCRHPA